MIPGTGPGLLRGTGADQPPGQGRGPGRGHHPAEPLPHGHLSRNRRLRGYISTFWTWSDYSYGHACLIASEVVGFEADSDRVSAASG
jgi:hypothetical protein